MSVRAWNSWQEATPRSRALFDRALGVLPGGVSSPVRGRASYDPYPIYIARGDGAHAIDVDGNSYVDVIMGLGPVILGHNHPGVVSAIAEQAAQGSIFAACTPLEIEVAERMRAVVPSLQMVRFANSGTEATMHALRLARGFTGKDKILKFEGHFHGNHDGVLVSVTPALTEVGSEELPNAIPVGAGIPADHYANTIVAVWNDIAIAKHAIAGARDELAAVIVEPVMANKGFIPPEPGYLQALRKITQDNGVLLIFDEVITGFRLAPGGAQEVFAVEADLVTYAKAMANGATIGAFGGRADIMSLLADGRVRHAGTYNAALVPLAAARATLDALAADEFAAYRRLEELGTLLADGLRAAIARVGVPAIVQGRGSMLQLYFTQATAIRNYRETSSVDQAKFSRFAHAMIQRGVLVHPDPFEHWFLSTAHTEEDVLLVVEAAEESLKTLA